MSKIFKAGCGCFALSVVTSTILIVGLWKVAMPRYLPFLESNVVVVVETAIMDFAAHHPDQVPATGINRDWAALLRGRKIAGVKLDYFIQGDQLVSLMRVPLEVETVGNYRVKVVSAGPDRVMGTTDDIDTVHAHQLLTEWEEKKHRAGSGAGGDAPATAR